MQPQPPPIPPGGPGGDSERILANMKGLIAEARATLSKEDFRSLMAAIHASLTEE